jgi:hypothetical protein
MTEKAVNLSPFANESEVLTTAGLTIENRLDRISVYGNIDITRDREGLTNAEVLKTVFNDIVATMKADHLEDKVSIKPVEEIANPFVDKGDKS